MDIRAIRPQALARRIAVVPQETSLAFDYTVLEIALMGRYPHLGAFEIEGPRDLAIALAALEATGTRAFADRPFRSLSGGEKQRVIIASALAQTDDGDRTGGAPGLLLLDEPTASLDLRYQLEIGALVTGLRRTRRHHGPALDARPALRGVGLHRDRDVVERPRARARRARRRADAGGRRRAVRGRAVARRALRHPMTASPLRRGVPFVVAGAAALVVATLGAPFIGSTGLHLGRVFDRSMPFADNVDAQIFFLARLPRALAAALVGATLAAAGVVFQGLLRNPLATPYTLGVSAGAALGAMVAITFGALWPIGGVGSASLAGALVAVLVVYALASARHRGLSTTVLLLAGVTLNAFFSALILFVQYLSDFADTYRALRWLMGDLDVASYLPILWALPFIAVAFAAFAWLARPLNLLSLGAEAAGTRGVNVALTQRVAFFSASIATGAAVSVGGPIGFVGIIVPHFTRLLVGADHRLVLPASAFFGGAFLVLCDAVARTVLPPLELPVGIITAVIGGPFFLWLLLRRR